MPGCPKYDIKIQNPDNEIILTFQKPGSDTHSQRSLRNLADDELEDEPSTEEELSIGGDCVVQPPPKTSGHPRKNEEPLPPPLIHCESCRSMEHETLYCSLDYKPRPNLDANIQRANSGVVGYRVRRDMKTCGLCMQMGHRMAECPNLWSIGLRKRNPVIQTQCRSRKRTKGG
ncbi:hypothetical protein AOL_s00006g234 [Orbilia oligospora ATCC 24927]|uniref:Uncharacterized protein n=1 Tax=Arthrobotrys oligospora (strain ATCC 24927 / CBS 115.81 / DSM 1491) TaxID=756982 RepID=G1X033_ARTOA|nr:hypothetical protein AOL_s00006g234 [Orbilia oligospora ATCC 24927]EGX53368.1 hypothetical protein AOL_s00006g234 [Orbilia oligospora ATCC 24927]